MNAYDIYMYENDPIFPVLAFFIEQSQSPWKEKFISQIGTTVTFLPGALDENDPWFINKLKSTFPYTIDSTQLQCARNTILLEEQENNEIRETKRVLLNSLYPNQINDFFILTIPEFMKDAGKTVPCDWPLSEIVLFLWKNDIPTGGWDVTDEGQCSIGITITNYANIDFDDMPEEEFREGLQNLLNKVNNLITSMYVRINHFIEFDLKDIHQVYTDLGLTFPDGSTAFQGGLIPYYGEAQGENSKYNKIFRVV